MHKRDGAIQPIGNIGARIAPCGPGAQRIAGGYATLPTTLAAELPAGSLCLGCVARTVRQDSAAGTVVVSYAPAEGAGGEDMVVEARRVILALPPRVVSGAIGFEPALPADQARKMASTYLCACACEYAWDVTLLRAIPLACTGQAGSLSCSPHGFPVPGLLRVPVCRCATTPGT